MTAPVAVWAKARSPSSWEEVEKTAVEGGQRMKTQVLLLTSWLGGALAVTCYQCSKVGWRKHGNHRGQHVYAQDQPLQDHFRPLL